MKSIAYKLSHFLHTSPSNILQHHLRILKYHCKNNPDFSRFLQSVCKLEKHEIKFLGGEYIEQVTEKIKVKKNLDLSGFC